MAIILVDSDANNASSGLFGLLFEQILLYNLPMLIRRFGG